MDHYSFSTGKDMKYTQDVLDLVKKHNLDNEPLKLTSDSKMVENTLA